MAWQVKLLPLVLASPKSTGLSPGCSALDTEITNVTVKAVEGGSGSWSLVPTCVI